MEEMTVDGEYEWTADSPYPLLRHGPETLRLTVVQFVRCCVSTDIPSYASALA